MAEPIAQKDSVSPISVMISLLKDYFFAIVGAAVVALILRVNVVEAFRIPSDFMAPTLLPGDHIFLNKLAYGGHFGMKLRMPVRGDVVVFGFPNDLTKDYIKRVVAIEGDTAEIKQGQVYINGKSISRQLSDDVFEEELEGHKYQAQWKGSPLENRKMMPLTVPSGQVFVLGDNRARGQDSRSWGFLQLSYLQGRASVIWFSTETANSSTLPEITSAKEAPGLFGVRWSRVITRVN